MLTAEDFDAEQEQVEFNRHAHCSVYLALAKCDDESRVAAQQALDNDDLFHTTVAKVLSRVSPVGFGAVSRHRRGVCQCPR